MNQAINIYTIVFFAILAIEAIYLLTKFVKLFVRKNGETTNGKKNTGTI